VNVTMDHPRSLLRKSTYGLQILRTFLGRSQRFPRNMTSCTLPPRVWRSSGQRSTLLAFNRYAARAVFKPALDLVARKKVIHRIIHEAFILRYATVVGLLN
jgi:hypothetical protein